MEYNDTSGKAGILQNCESLSKLGDGGITSNATLLGKFTGWVNDSYHKVARAILTVDKQWRWDDFNWPASPNGFPVATTTLVSGQRDVQLPRATNTSDMSTLWKIYKVRLKNTNGDWYDVEPLSGNDSEIAGTGKPKNYRLLGNYIRLSDIPDTSIDLTQGIQVWFQREFVKFTTSSTSEQPGFLSSYHHLLALDASATFLLPTDTQLSASYIALFQQGLNELKVSYAQRNDDPNVVKRLAVSHTDNR